MGLGRWLKSLMGRLAPRRPSPPNDEAFKRQPQEPAAVHAPGPSSASAASIIYKDAAGTVVPSANQPAPKLLPADRELVSSRTRRHLRTVAFALFALISTAYFGALLWLIAITAINSPSWWFLQHLSHQSALLIGGALIILASIPLSLTLAMVKLAQDPDDASDRGTKSDTGLNAITTPGLEAIKSIADAIKSATGK